MVKTPKSMETDAAKVQDRDSDLPHDNEILKGNDMGRKLRMVPKGWKHPRDDKGNFVPLFEGPYSKRVADWDEENSQWNAGYCLDFGAYPEKAWVARAEDQTGPFEEWDGARPVANDYMPEFPDDLATHFMMYEDTSEGTPISPAFETPEQLAEWLANNGASAFADMTATYDQWLDTINRGSAVSMVIDKNGFRSGVAAMADD